MSHVFDDPDDQPPEFPAHDHEDQDDDGFVERHSVPDDFLEPVEGD